ncbi:MAG: methyltransferase [Nostoc sp.]|uniref:methyltransferase n=1 Tax=Nostoc sp. TaxID=1180 RepID=UPI002FFB3639
MFREFTLLTLTAATAVKHQADRQQTVIDTGVYSIVRHPMYAGAVLVMVGMSLWL